MHTFLSWVAYFAVLIFLLLIVRWIPPQESMFRIVIALTWLLWVFVGLAYGIRATWRFLRG